MASGYQSLLRGLLSQPAFQQPPPPPLTPPSLPIATGIGRGGVPQLPLEGVLEPAPPTASELLSRASADPLSLVTFTCVHCNAPRQSGVRCEHCGEALPTITTCQRCQSAARGSYCCHCGASLSRPAVPAAAEWKTVEAAWRDRAQQRLQAAPPLGATGLRPTVAPPW